MRVSKIKVNNFKSLVDFEMGLAKFTCLVGLNGSGKSTVLQFVDFLCQLVRGEVRAWLKERNWANLDLVAWRAESTPISFAVEMADAAGAPAGRWAGTFDPAALRCETELFEFGDTRFEVVDLAFLSRRPNAQGKAEERRHEITMEYEGSILSKVRSEFLPGPVAAFRDFFRSARTLELLSPGLMRQMTRGPAGTVGRGGERLSAYLYDLPEDQRAAIERRLRAVYPHFRSLSPRAGRAGEKVLEVDEEFRGRSFRTEARHVNDGLLRLLAVLTNLESGSPLLAFDEIENGINTELVEFLVDALVEARPQVIVTTHNPVILNYLKDEVAQESMVYLYKTPEGDTRAVRFFDIPRMAKKLTMMGPGEAYGDTDLSRLNDEILQAQRPA
jgi:predicted ATPase